MQLSCVCVCFCQRVCMCARGALRQYEKHSDKTKDKSKGTGMTISQLKQAGYTEAHIASMLKNCEEEYDEEISDRRFVVYARCSWSGGVVRPNLHVASVKNF